MPEPILLTLLWFCALGSALIAGLFFAFSAFIMTALGSIEPRAGVAAMNAVNSVILRSLFMPVFLGSSLAALALAVFAVFDLAAPGAPVIAAAGAIYVLGMFGCTMAFNVPLNNALMRAEASGAEKVWARYLKEWTAWNHVRTLASLAACALYIVAIAAR
jgi:uncharacterized membrane protein